MSPALPSARAAQAICCVALRHDDGRPARRYHQHRSILADGLIVEVDADDGVGSGVPGSLDHLADREILGPLQLALVGGGTAADNVADAGEHVPEGVRTQDRLAGYNPLVVVDVPVLECAGGRQQHACLPSVHDDVPGRPDRGVMCGSYFRPLNRIAAQPARVDKEAYSDHAVEVQTNYRRN